MRPTPDEVLRALGDDELPAYVIGQRIEEQWELDGRRSRFLFWTFAPVMSFSTMYREMPKLRKAGFVTCRQVRDTRPGGVMRCLYRKA